MKGSATLESILKDESFADEEEQKVSFSHVNSKKPGARARKDLIKSRLMLQIKKDIAT